MEHADLMAELPLIEKLTAVERIQLAKQRRALQLMRWQEREQKEASCDAVPVVPSRRRKVHVRFGSGTVLLEATSRHDVDEVCQLLNDGADPNSHNEDGLTALHQCAIDDEDVIMQVLIDHGADVNSRDSEMWTPLHAAACCGHIRAMRILIENGAELLAVNSDGNMPYDICDEEAALDYVETEMANRGITQEDIDEERSCNERRMLEEMQVIHARGDSLDIRDKGGATPLHAACANGYYSVAEFLLECGCWVHVRDNDGWQPIHGAACWAQPDLVELLVQFGADINARTNSGETPLDLCEDDTTRNVILTLQVEMHRRRLLTFARDSRRMSKRKKPCSKFESPAPVAVTNPESRFSSTRSAVRRMSVRDRCGVTLARLEARREAAVMRSWSFGESDITDSSQQPPSAQTDSGGKTVPPQKGGAEGAPSSTGIAAKVAHPEQPRKPKAMAGSPVNGSKPQEQPTETKDQERKGAFNFFPAKVTGEKATGDRPKRFWEKLYGSSPDQAEAKPVTAITVLAVKGDGKKFEVTEERSTAPSVASSSSSTPSSHVVTVRCRAVDERRKGTSRSSRSSVDSQQKLPNAHTTATTPPSDSTTGGGDSLLKPMQKESGPAKSGKISRLKCCVIS
uniref:ANK_REP_REGION domain-containing protein n=1 Tax=Trichuris muris TaxID=70415 RepID=A0A5S6Q9L9_TRIMR